MRVREHMTTWLELAAASRWRQEGAKVRMHPAGGPRNACFALSMDDKWLCGNDGRLTVFHDTRAVIRFLALLNIPDFELGEPAPLPVGCSDEAQCMGLRGRKLANCNHRRTCARPAVAVG